jgi:hypothetical protein
MARFASMNPNAHNYRLWILRAFVFPTALLLKGRSLEVSRLLPESHDAGLPLAPQMQAIRRLLAQPFLKILAR